MAAELLPFDRSYRRRNRRSQPAPGARTAAVVGGLSRLARLTLTDGARTVSLFSEAEIVQPQPLASEAS